MGNITGNYNLSQLQDVSSLGSAASWANTVTNDVFWGGIIIALFFIILILSYRKVTADDAVGVSSIICFVLSLLLTYAELVTFMLTLFFGVLGAIIIAVKVYTKR